MAPKKKKKTKFGRPLVVTSQELRSNVCYLSPFRSFVMTNEQTSKITIQICLRLTKAPLKTIRCIVMGYNA